MIPKKKLENLNKLLKSHDPNHTGYEKKKLPPYTRIAMRSPRDEAKEFIVSSNDGREVRVWAKDEASAMMVVARVRHPIEDKITGQTFLGKENDPDVIETFENLCARVAHD